ncbi:LOW QUALITY PROTEIN: tektin-B1-like, partial [Gigantopelta aegis]|uniref:LOW QUALITY PROTEIN: tektin-B1-like n=1 Tax=Gigantopelta aegis TaxID=1735272 RepID=UPI001B88E227
EAEVIDGIKKQLQQRINESFEQLCLLQEAQQQVQVDLQDKNIALGIDIDQYNLSDKFPNISFKPDSLRVPKGSTTPQQWEDFSRYNKDRADAEMKASNNLRKAIHHTLQQTDNDLEAQRIAMEYALRKRIHKFERVKDELEWQKKNVSFHKYIVGSQSLHALDGLEKNLHRINDDLAKNNSPMLDNRCMNIRQKLQTRPQTSIERNLTITGIEREKTKILA